MTSLSKKEPNTHFKATPREERDRKEFFLEDGNQTPVGRPSRNRFRIINVIRLHLKLHLKLSIQRIVDYIMRSPLEMTP